MNIAMLNRAFERELVEFYSNGKILTTVGQVIDAAQSNAPIDIRILKDFRFELSYENAQKVSKGITFMVADGASFLEYINTITAVYE